MMCIMLILYYLLVIAITVCATADENNSKSPNVIVILADDLGYGDTSIFPFTSPQFQDLNLTPELQRMANSGKIMTNFHVASPICSPARASIMTGLFPWRLGVDFIYAQDQKLDGSEELDHEQMPLVPNLAMSFRDNGYFTAHIGKWHLGGLKPEEISSRVSEHHYQQGTTSQSRISNSNACSTPGLIQYGYDEYVCMSEGNYNSARYKTQQKGATYKHGARHLFRNDVVMPPPKVDQWLTDVQTDEAMRVVRERTHNGSPFFLNLWYDAPHSPWESVEPFFSEIARNSSSILPTRLHKYMSMIANMDWNIGRLLQQLDDLGIANNTIILFTSDNGPEVKAGSGGPFQGGKRVLMEGGIRVPAIWQWKGHIAAGTKTSAFGLSTDIYPTLMQASGLAIASHVRIDGISLLPIIQESDTTSTINANDKKVVPINLKSNVSTAYGDERTLLWYTHCPGYPKFSAAWSHGFKLVWNDYEGRRGAKLPPPLRFFDMRNDPYEKHDLLPKLMKNCEIFLSGQSTTTFTWQDFNDIRTVDNDLNVNNNALKLLKLLYHLHLKMHLFRFIGNEDWLRYHANKPYLMEKHCARRRSKVDTLLWGTVLPPEFCGDGIASDIGSANCRCSFSNCPQSWFHTNESSNPNAGWASGPVYDGFDILGVLDSPQQKHLANILEWSNFQPICFDSSSLKAKKTKKIKQLKQKNVLVSSNTPNLITELYSTKSYQRVFKRDDHNNVYVTGSTCVSGKPVAWQNEYGMHAPLSLCSESLNAMNSKKKGVSPKFDDGAFLFALNDVLFTNDTTDRSPTVRHFHNNFLGAFDDDNVTLGQGANYSYDSTPLKSLSEFNDNLVDIAVIDPMYAFHVLHAGGNPVDMGFFMHIRHRLHAGHAPVMLVCPILLEHGWASLFLVIPPSTKYSQQLPATFAAMNSPIAIYVQPNSHNEGVRHTKTDDSSISSSSPAVAATASDVNIAKKLLKGMLQVVRKARTNDSNRRWIENDEAITVIDFRSTISVKSLEINVAISGLRVLLFANSLRQAFLRMLPITEVLESRRALQGILDTSVEVIENLTRECASRYMRRSIVQATFQESSIRNATYTLIQ